MSCATSIHFSGCLNGSTRDLSADLTRDASQSAMKAEEQIAERRRAEALARTDQKATKPENTELAAVTRPDSSKAAASQPVDGKSVAGTVTDRSRTLAASKGEPVQPVAAKKGGVDNPGKAQLPKSALAEFLAEERPRSAVELAQGIDIDSAANSIELVGGKEPAGTARPFPVSDDESSKAAAPAADNPFAAATVSAVKQTPNNAPPKAKVVGPEPPTDWPAASTAGRPTTKPTPPAAKTQGLASDWGLAPAQAATPATPSTAVTATPPAQPSALKPVAASPAEREQRLRIKALLSEAHTSVIRGELHAGYRSALLAEKIASDHQLTFRGTEENPSVVAKSIAGKIWKLSDEPALEGLASPATTVAPVVTAKPTLPASHESAFAKWDSLDSWTSVKGQRDAAPSASAAGAPAPTGSQDVMPEIRPGYSTTATEIVAPRNLPAAAAATSIDLTPPALSAPDRLQHIDPFSPDNGVKFAIAESVHSPRESSHETGFSHLLTSPLGLEPQVSEGGPLAGTTSRPVLMSPLAAPGAETAAVDTEPTIAWDRISGRQARQEALKSGFWQFVWGLGGLAAAAVALGVGVQLHRKRSESATTTEQESAQPEVAEQTENPPLRIKHAA